MQNELKDKIGLLTLALIWMRPDVFLFLKPDRAARSGRPSENHFFDQPMVCSVAVASSMVKANRIPPSSHLLPCLGLP